MTSRSQPIAPHPPIVGGLIRGLPKGSQPNNDITSLNMSVVDDITALHAAGDRTIYDDRTYEVTDISRLTTRGIDINTLSTKLSKELLCTIDDRSDDLTRDEMLVAPNRRGDEDAIDSPHAQQVVNVHNQRILCYTLPDREVTRLTPIDVGQRRLRARTICMHDVTIGFISPEDIGDDLTESLRIKALVYVADGSMHILLGG